MSTPILCVECARQKQPPRTAVWESRAGDICEPCRGALGIPRTECDPLIGATFDREVDKKSGGDKCERTELCPKPAGHRGQCLGGKRRAKVWSDEDEAQLRRSQEEGATIVAVEKDPQISVVEAMRQGTQPIPKMDFGTWGKIKMPTEDEQTVSTVNIPITEEHLNRFWNRLTLAEKADVFVRSL